MNAPVNTLNLLPAQDSAGQGHYGTHIVKNQAMPLTGFNAFEHDAVLSAAVQREAPWAARRCQALGQLVGDEAIQELARLANRHLPELTTHDRYGNRIDWVEFHPSWHQLMALAWKHEVHSLAWTAREPQPHFARAALSYLWNQVEHGTACPTGMAYASLRIAPCAQRICAALAAGSFAAADFWLDGGYAEPPDTVCRAAYRAGAVRITDG